MKLRSIRINSNNDGEEAKNFIYNTIEEARFINENLDITKKSIVIAREKLISFLKNTSRSETNKDPYNNDLIFNYSEVSKVIGYKSNSELKKSEEFNILSKIVDANKLIQVIKYLEKTTKLTLKIILAAYRFVSESSNVTKFHVYKMMLLLGYEYKKDCYSVGENQSLKSIKELIYLGINYSNLISQDHEFCYINILQVLQLIR